MSAFSSVFQYDESGRRPAGISALLIGLLGLAIAVTLSVWTGRIRTGPFSPEYRLYRVSLAEADWESRWSQARGLYQKRLPPIYLQLMKAPWNPVDPDHGQSPLADATQVRPTLELEYHRHPDGRPYWITLEVPQVLTGDSRTAYIAHFLSEFIRYEAKVDLFLTEREKLLTSLRLGTTRAPWFENDADSRDALRIKLSAQVGRMLVDRDYRDRARSFPPATDLARVIFDAYGSSTGELTLPPMSFARNPKESTELTSLSPLRLMPLFRQAAPESGQPFELVKLVEAAWSLVTVMRNLEGEPLYPKIGTLAKEAPDLVCHIWLWEYLIDSHAGRADSTFLMNMNPLLHLTRALVFQHCHGMKPESPEVAALFSEKQCHAAELANIGPEFYWAFFTLYDSRSADDLKLLW